MSFTQPNFDPRLSSSAAKDLASARSPLGHEAAAPRRAGPGHCGEARLGAAAACAWMARTREDGA